MPLDSQVTDGRIFGIAERSSTFLSSVLVKCQRMAVAVEGASERMAARSHHFIHFNVISQQHRLSAVVSAALDHVSEGIPVNVIANYENGVFILFPLHKIGFAGLEARQVVAAEVHGQRTVGKRGFVERLHRSASKR